MSFSLETETKENETKNGSLPTAYPFKIGICLAFVVLVPAKEQGGSDDEGCKGRNAFAVVAFVAWLFFGVFVRCRKWQQKSFHLFA